MGFDFAFVIGFKIEVNFIWAAHQECLQHKRAAQKNVLECPKTLTVSTARAAPIC